MPVVKPLAKVDARTMKRVDERGFHEARFVDRATRAVVRARRPLDHPVKDFELTELRLPLWETFGAQIIHEGMLAGSCTHSEQRTQFFIQQIPFLLEAIKSAGG